MKSVKVILTVLPLMLVTVLSFGQQVEKTLVKAFNLQGKQLVTLDLDGVVEVTPWDNDIMRIQMQISLNGSNTMLKSMVQAGRYRLLSKVEGDQFVVYTPGMNKDLNKKLEERIVYKVFIPIDVELRVEDEVMSSKEDAGKEKF